MILIKKSKGILFYALNFQVKIKYNINLHFNLENLFFQQLKYKFIK